MSKMKGILKLQEQALGQQKDEISVRFTLSFYLNRETSQNARSFRSNMAERQRFGYLDTWPCNCKQIPSLRFPISAESKSVEKFQVKPSVDNRV